MMIDHGLKTVASAFSVRETIERLARIATARGMVVFARIDHAAGAPQVGMALRPTELVLFGNPRGGTPLMQERQTAGVDIPLKALAWEDAAGRVWLTYNEIPWLAERHGIGVDAAEALAALATVQEGIITAASRSQQTEQHSNTVRSEK